jgi:hypothetical protein
MPGKALPRRREEERISTIDKSMLKMMKKLTR